MQNSQKFHGPITDLGSMVFYNFTNSGQSKIEEVGELHPSITAPSFSPTFLSSLIPPLPLEIDPLKSN